MPADSNQITFSIWAADNVVYGPVELPALIAWVKDERVLADTWIFDGGNDRWRKASTLPELQMFFRKRGGARNAETQVFFDKSNITPDMLRRVKALAEFTDEQLARFAQYMETLTVHPFVEIVKHGDPDDGMFLVMDGEVRVRLMIGGKETVLATLASGDCFGEVALFDQGTRSADVISNTDCILLKISSEAFRKIAA